MINFVIGGGDLNKGKDLDKKVIGGYIIKLIIFWIGEVGKEFVILVDNN